MREVGERCARRSNVGLTMGKYEYGSRSTFSVLGFHDSLMPETGLGGSFEALKND